MRTLMETNPSLYLNIILQPVILLLIPFIWWLVTARRKEGFFHWLGLYRPGERPGRAIAISLAVFAVFAAVSVVFAQAAAGKNAASINFHGEGWSVLPAVIGYGVLQTGFTEEALFRGFLLRRVASRFGFTAGNTVQAILFGLVHFVGMFAPLGVGWAVGIGVFTGLLGAAAGYVNERFAKGSIVPSWIGHALGNTITGLLAAFSVV